MMAVEAGCHVLYFALVRRWTNNLSACPNTLGLLCLNWAGLSHSDTLSMTERSWPH